MTYLYSNRNSVHIRVVSNLQNDAPSSSDSFSLNLKKDFGLYFEKNVLLHTAIDPI